MLGKRVKLQVPYDVWVVLPLSLPEKCRGVLPEDYFFASECEAECFCNSESFEEYLECVSSCSRGYSLDEPLLD